MVIHPCSDYAQLCLALVFTSEYSCSAPVTLLLYLQSRVSVRMVAGNGCKWIVQIQNVWVSWAFCSDFHNFLSILLDFHSFLSIFLRLAQNFASILLRLLQGWRPMIIGVPPHPPSTWTDAHCYSFWLPVEPTPTLSCVSESVCCERRVPGVTAGWTNVRFCGCCRIDGSYPWYSGGGFVCFLLGAFCLGC